MDRNKLIATLRQIKNLAKEAIDDRVKGRQTLKSQVAPAARSGSVEIDFSKPLRPFVKTYGKGLSGPKKFALLLSWLSKGDLKKQVPLSEIQKQWNRMTAKPFLGMKFNRFFPAEARSNDWVELKKKGLYSLRPSWRDIFRNGD